MALLMPHGAVWDIGSTSGSGKIANYQVITPTTWNGSPRDSSGRRGHWEESFIGLEIKDLDNPVELCHVVRSHDACLVCTVHFAKTGKQRHVSGLVRGSRSDAARRVLWECLAGR